MVVSSVWPGSTRVSGGSFIRTSITECADTLEVAAADGVLEQRVACEHGLAIDDKRDHVVGVTGSRQRLDLEPSDFDRIGPDGETEGLLVDDVVGVRVGAQDVARLDAPARRRLLQRPDVGPGVDEQRRAALLVCDEVGVRQPVGVHAPFDEHGGTLPGHLR